MFSANGKDEEETEKMLRYVGSKILASYYQSKFVCLFNTKLAAILCPVNKSLKHQCFQYSSFHNNENSQF